MRKTCLHTIPHCTRKDVKCQQWSCIVVTHWKTKEIERNKEREKHEVGFSCLRVLGSLILFCTTFHRYPIFSTRYSVMCKVYTGYCGTSEIEHGLCACTVDNPLAKARGLSLRTGAQHMLYLSLEALKIFEDHR